MTRAEALCAHFPVREGWGGGVMCLCRRQFASMELWARHALAKVDENEGE
jgi:hypothetical protein